MATNDAKRAVAAIEASVIAEGDMANASLRLRFANGAVIQLDPYIDLTPEMRHAAMLHGLKQKLVDAAAISRNPDTGASATVADKYAAVKEVYDRLLTGQWNKPRGDGTSAEGGLLYRALCKMQPGKPAEAIRAWLDARTKEEQAALRVNPAVKAVIDELRPKGGVAAEEKAAVLLSELDGI